MGMRPVDIIAIVGKTHDAAQAAQNSARAHDNMQDQMAFRRIAEADHSSEQVSSTAEEDRLELNSGDGGSGGGAGYTGSSDEEEGEPGDGTQDVPPIHQIDFLA